MSASKPSHWQDGRGAAGGVEGARRATGTRPAATRSIEVLALRPVNPEVEPKAQRRRFTVAYKLEIVKQAEECRSSADIGALLRREGLYGSHLSKWRKLRDEGGLVESAPRQRGRKPDPATPLYHRAKELERENERLRRKLKQAETVIEIQKKSLRDPGDHSDRTRPGEDRLMDGVEQLASTVGFQTACRALDVSRSSFYRRRRNPAKPPAVTRPRPASPRRLSEAERQQVLDLLHSNRFVDAAPAQVYAALLEEATYLCSERTMYRLLQSQQEVRERRNQLRHPAYSKPELLATAPNQVWSWDITKLRGPAKGLYYSLYVVLDIFSRYVVGWLLAEREAQSLANRLLAETSQIPPAKPEA